MYLSHHYTQYTALSLMKKPEVQELFQIKLPREASKFPCLMHGLMALSALHLAHRLPSEKGTWIPIAFRHQGRALAGLRSSLQSLDEHNCHALYALSCIVFVTSLPMSSGAEILRPKDSNPTDHLIEPLLLIQGILNVAAAGAHWITKGMMAPIFSSYEIDVSTDMVLPVAIESQFLLISGLIEDEVADCDAKASLLVALNALELVYREVLHTDSSGYLNPGLIWKWPNCVGPGYITLLRDSESSALVIYAHFAILSDALHNEWYFEGWAERVVSGISKIVESRWRTGMEWPEHQIKEGLSHFGHGRVV